MGDSTLDNFFDTDAGDLLSGLEAGLDPMLSSTSLPADQGEPSLIYSTSGGFSDQAFVQPVLSSPAGGLTSQGNTLQLPSTAPIQRQVTTIPQQLYISNLASNQQQNYVLTAVGASSAPNQGTTPIRIVRLPAQSAGNQGVVRLVATSQSTGLRATAAAAQQQLVRLQSSPVAPASAILATQQPDASSSAAAQQGSLPAAAAVSAQQTRMVYLPAGFAGNVSSPSVAASRTRAPVSQSQQQAGNVLLQGGKAYVTVQAGGAQGMTLIMPCSTSITTSAGSAASAGGSSPGAGQVAGQKPAAGQQQPLQIATLSGSLSPAGAQPYDAAAAQAEMDGLKQQLKLLTGGSGRKSQAAQQQIADLQEKVRTLTAQQQQSSAATTAAAAAAAAAATLSTTSGRRSRRGATAQQSIAAGSGAQASQAVVSTGASPAALLLGSASQQQPGSGQLLAAAAKDVKAQQAREKSIQIAQEAIEKARAAGVTSVPGVTALPAAAAVIPSTVDTAYAGTSSGERTPAKKGAAKSKHAVCKRKTKFTPLAAGRPGRRKRKQADSSDLSELDMSPPQSPVSQEDLTVKRRSGRVTKRTKYVDEVELDITDDEDKDDDPDEMGEGIMFQDHDATEGNVSEHDTVIVEKILGMRKAKPAGTAGRKDQAFHLAEPSATAISQPSLNIDESESDEFFVKYKNYSFLHCEWKTAAELEKGDKRIRSKIKRFRLKRLQQSAFFAEPDEDELFNPEYTEVERVLCESRTPDSDEPGKEAVHYLVKWRQLPYEDSTWELEQDVVRSKIEQFRNLNNSPAEQLVKPRPAASEWVKLDASRPYNNDNILRPYQHEGVNWLTFCYYTGQNCILADEMGLGKTIQSIAFLQEMFDYGIHGPFLVVAPLSTIANWLREFEQWTDMNTIVYHGSAASRSMLQEYEMYHKDEQGYRLVDVYKFHAMITTYEVIIQDVEILSDITWRCCIIDEAHRLKNKHSKLLEGLRCFELEHKVLLSGTPLQNNVQELFSLLNFLEPDRFHSAELFLTEFGDLKTEAQVERLKAILKPMMLRRLKEDVEKNLAPKEETIIEVELTAVQKQYYRAILEKNFSFLSKTHSSNLPSLMNTMMELRKCCNHPYLVNGAEERILEEARERHTAVQAANGTLPSGQLPMFDAEHLLNVMVQASGKLVLLDKLLPKLKAGDHKVLIFSQMIRVLDILEDYLIQRKYCYERLDGRIRGNLRQEAIDRFSKPDTDRFVFLLCTRAGGLGINLTAADTCIIYDSDWNPQNDLQAQARCHRIGQEKAVKVYRLICRKTYEREMFDRASKKLGLDKAVLQSMSAKENTSQATLTKKEVEDLLKRGAYGALMDDDHAGDQFCEEDIDLILQRRTQIITIDSVGKGSTFAKASFSSSGTVDIDINDPEFWQKWAKRAELDTEKAKRKNELVIEEPRQRKQTARYGNQNAMMEELPSELESSTESEQDEKLARATSGTRRGGRRGRRRADDDSDTDALPPPGAFTRPECFKVEKHLLVYGWGRWRDIVVHAKFKRQLSEEDVETIARAMLHYSLKHYKGDERIKAFIWDLITPSEDGSTKNIKNHSGLAAPVPRGRKRRQDKKDPGAVSVMSVDEKIAKCDHVPEAVLVDSGYRRHLTRHANKLLLRVRLLYYLKQEILGDQASKVFEGLPVSQLDMAALPPTDGELPTLWWDEEADRCLLVGIYKHGYEKYNAMRGDPDLCFLGKCGPPDCQALAQEQAAADEDGPGIDEDDADKSIKLEDDEDDAASTHSKKSSAVGADLTPVASSIALANGKLPFPSTSDLNTRLRRLITSYQRNNKRRQDQHEKQQLRWERSQAAIRGRNIERSERKSRWTRKEESDFYRVVNAFGIERDRQTGRYLWDTFRRLGNLGKKDDDQLTEYFQAFYRMCQRVSGRQAPHEEGRPAVPSSVAVESLSENQATRCLARVDLLTRIREEILWHPRLTEHLKLCQPSSEMPSWWQCGEHDKDLLIGAAKHGLTHTEYHIQSDRKLCFHSIIENLMRRVMKLGGNQPLSSSVDRSASVSGSAGSINNGTEEHDAATGNDDRANNVHGESPNRNRGGNADSHSPGAEEKGFISVGSPPNSRQLTSSEVISSSADMENGCAAEVNCGGEEKPGVKTETVSKVEEDAADRQSLGDLTADSLRSEYGSQHRILPNVQWPKDRVIFQRLDHICHCIEHGEWPSVASMRKLAILGYESLGGADSPSGTPNPFTKPATPLDEYNIVDNDEGDGLKITLSKQRQRKSQHYSRVDADTARIAKLRDGADSAASSPHGTNSKVLDRSLSNNLVHASGPGPSGNAFEGEDYSDLRPSKRRGRKVKTGRTIAVADLGAACDVEAVAGVASSESMLSLHPSSQADLEARVSVVNMEDGSRLSGDDAPRLRDLDRWPVEHPAYNVDSPQHEGAVVRQKRRRVDPDLLDLNTLTGDENVSVFNRETGKKITGVKAPQLKLLASWLEKNTSFDVDRKWSTLVRARGNLSEELLSRVQSPIEKKTKRPRSSASTATAFANAAMMTPPSASAAALMAASLQNYPMNLAAAYSNFAAMGMTQPGMLGMYNVNVPSPAAAANANDDSDTPAAESSSSTSAAAAAVSTHSAFPPYMYGPHHLAYATMLAGMGLTSSSSASSLAAAAAYPHPAMLNGLMNSMLGAAAAAAAGEGGGEARELAASLRHAAAAASASSSADHAGATAWPKAAQQHKAKRSSSSTTGASEPRSATSKRSRGGGPAAAAAAAVGSPANASGSWQQRGGHDYAEMPQDLSMKKAIMAHAAAERQRPASSKSRVSVASSSLMSNDDDDVAPAASVGERTRANAEADSANEDECRANRRGDDDEEDDEEEEEEDGAATEGVQQPLSPAAAAAADPEHSDESM